MRLKSWGGGSIKKRAKNWVSRLKLGLQGLVGLGFGTREQDLSLEAGIWALRLGSGCEVLEGGSIKKKARNWVSRLKIWAIRPGYRP